jgi:hypothetical protein
MEIQIIIDIFSGRENPVIELEGDEAKETLERLKPSSKLKKDDLGIPPSSTPGYRGLIIKQKGKKSESKDLPKTFRLVNGDLFGPRLSHRATDENYEDFFCSPRGPIRKINLGRNFPGFLRTLYEPDWWNDGGQIQFNNNCYNYGSNYRTDTYAQPGRAAGAMYTSLYCVSVKPAAVADALIDTPRANNKCPKEGHLVALVIAPGGDFHWYRKGRNGYWTHKPGGTPATNLDNSEVTISDPRTADRGPYTDFCSFMVVMHGHIKIN